MLKQISKIKFIIAEILEKELLTVLALSVVMLGVWLAKADTGASTNLSLSILDGGTLTVTSPNGSENWQVDSSQHITWTSTGSIANVKIELQRTTGGSWETLTSSTTNDGDYPWTVTSPTSTTATVKITSTTNSTITDNSNTVFTISAAAGSSGGYLPTYPLIDSVSPLTFYRGDATELIIRGLGFKDNTRATLNQVVFPVQKPHGQNLMTINLLPNTLALGTYRLCLYNSDWEYDCYRNLITVTDETKPMPPTTGGGGGEEYLAALIKQSPDLTLEPRATAVIWVEYKNTGTVTWYQDGPNPVRLGTDNKRDRNSVFYHSSWIKYNRPVLVNKVVKPGEIGRFEFTIRAPWTGKVYTEYFKPVAEYKTWIGGASQVKWIFTVKKVSLWNLIKRAVTLTPKSVPTPSSVVVPKPNVPSTGGSVITPFKPGATLLFSDGIEKIYQGTLKLFNGFMTSFRK